MTQIAVDDRLIEKARTVTALESDERIVRAALNVFIGHAEAYEEAFRRFEEIRKEPGYEGWDPEFDGWDKRDIK
ncbi:MAG: type II toxin-antitoxin system VapB family antitoxin [Spirochaetaceae bacterium]|nr:type II toxin-antitoxin system VapB family antitoxin [Spirochaetaceae bacterium]